MRSRSRVRIAIQRNVDGLGRAERRLEVGTDHAVQSEGEADDPVVLIERSYRKSDRTAVNKKGPRSSLHGVNELAARARRAREGTGGRVPGIELDADIRPDHVARESCRDIFGGECGR